MSARDKKRYDALKADPVKYEAYLEAKRQQRAARQTIRAYETQRKRKWRLMNPFKAKLIRQANHAVEAAMKGRKLHRPSMCFNCGTVGKVEAHHHRGYAKEFWLDVLWLCVRCHRKAEEVSNDL